MRRAGRAEGGSTSIGTAGRSRESRRAVEPDEVKQTIAAAPTVPAMLLTAGGSAGAGGRPGRAAGVGALRGEADDRRRADRAVHVVDRVGDRVGGGGIGQRLGEMDS